MYTNTEGMIMTLTFALAGTTQPSMELFLWFDILTVNKIIEGTVLILSFRINMPRQTVQTQIRLLLEEQSDQGLHCLPFHLHRLDSLLYGRAT